MSLDRTEILHKRGEVGREIDTIVSIIDSRAFPELTDEAKVLLLRQHDAMVHYHEILCSRISEMDGAWTGEPEDQMVKPFIERLKAWWDS